MSDLARPTLCLKPSQSVPSFVDISPFASVVVLLRHSRRVVCLRQAHPASSVMAPANSALRHRSSSHESRLNLAVAAGGVSLAGHVRGQLLDGDGLARVEQVVHLPQRVFAGHRRRRRRRRGLGRRRRVVRGCGRLRRGRNGSGGRRGAGGGTAAAAAEGLALRVLLGFVGRLVAASDTDIGFPGLVDALLVLVENADGAVLADAVAHLERVDPHGELRGERGVDEGRREAAALAGLRDDRVHLAVDPDASVARSLEGLLREPVVAVPAPQHLHQRQLELFQLVLVDVAAPQLDEVDQEVRGGL